MAKKVTKKPAGKRRTRSSEKSAAPKRATSVASRPRGQKQPSAKKAEPTKSAADALVDLLESPLVADILAAGAAAALATMTAHGLSRRREGSSTRQALKRAGKAAASAMGARISEEFEEILARAKQVKREES